MKVGLSRLQDTLGLRMKMERVEDMRKGELTLTQYRNSCYYVLLVFCLYLFHYVVLGL